MRLQSRKRTDSLDEERLLDDSIEQTENGYTTYYQSYDKSRNTKLAKGNRILIQKIKNTLSLIVRNL